MEQMDVVEQPGFWSKRPFCSIITRQIGFLEQSRDTVKEGGFLRNCRLWTVSPLLCRLTPSKIQAQARVSV